MSASWEDDGEAPRTVHPYDPDSGPVNRLETDKSGEPVAIAELVRLAAAGLAAVGWAVIPSDAVNAVATGLAAVVSIVATVLARRRVKPLAK